MLTATLTIPEDEEVTGGVMDDVDDDGRHYNRSLDGPATYTVEYWENEYPDAPGEFWIIPDEALAIPVDNVPAEWITNERRTP